MTNPDEETPRMTQFNRPSTDNFHPLLILAKFEQLTNAPGISRLSDTFPAPDTEMLPVSAKSKPSIVPKPLASIVRLRMTTFPFPCFSSVAPEATETDSQFPNTLNVAGVSGVPRIGKLLPSCHLRPSRVL